MRVDKSGLIICYTCGAALERRKDGVYVCPGCGNEYPDVKKDETAEVPSQIAELLNSADTDRKLRRFNRALETYDAVISQDNKNVLAYWGAFLSEFGVEYVKEGERYVPRMHCISRQSANGSQYLNHIYDLCNEVDGANYRQKADEIEQLRYRTYQLSQSQENYDVYICCGDSGIETDSAKTLYEELKSTGLRVFLPSVSIPYGTPSKEACIFAASESAQVMFVVADSVQTLEKNDYVWSRFLKGDGKRIQVVHNGLNESAFPSGLRKTFQRQAPINLNDRNWLQKAKDFTKPQETVAPRAEAAQTVVTERIILQDRRAASLAEAMTMVLSYLTTGNYEGGYRIVQEQFVALGGAELVPVATLCVELAALSKAPAADRRMHIDTIQNIGGEIKRNMPYLSDLERSVYCSVKDANLLIYLAKCFGAIKDRDRQCFVLDMIDYHNIYNTRTVTELVQMLLTNGRTDEVGEVMRNVKAFDGNALLVAYLSGFNGDSVQKQVNLRNVADKLTVTNAVADDLNAYLSECDDEGVALAVLDIMNKHNIPLTAMGLSGALGNVTDAESAKTVLENFGKRPLQTIEMDKLVQLAANGGDAVANEVLRHLRYQSGITDLGVFNMRTILDKCDLEKIRIAFFDFNINKKLAEELLRAVIKGNSPNRLATASVLVSGLNNIDIANYAPLLTGGDPLKKDFMKLLAPKTGKYADANKYIESFLTGRDTDEDKREIFAMFGDFPFSDNVLKLYLEIIPESYDEEYLKFFYPYLENHPAEARAMFVKHYESLAEGYGEQLVKMLSYIRAYDDAGIARFITEFRGSQEVKDRLVMRLIEYSDKPKKAEVICGKVQCNFLQAYLLTLKENCPSVDGVINCLKKKGMDASDKIIYGGRKMKFKEYLQSGEVSGATVNLILSHVKV